MCSSGVGTGARAAPERGAASACVRRPGGAACERRRRVAAVTDGVPRIGLPVCLRGMARSGVCRAPSSGGGPHDSRRPHSVMGARGAVAERGLRDFRQSFPRERSQGWTDSWSQNRQQGDAGGWADDRGDFRRYDQAPKDERKALKKEKKEQKEEKRRRYEMPDRLPDGNWEESRTAAGPPYLFRVGGGLGIACKSDGQQAGSNPFAPRPVIHPSLQPLQGGPWDPKKRAMPRSLAHP